MIRRIETPAEAGLVCRVELDEPLGIGTRLFEHVQDAADVPLVHAMLGVTGVRSVVARGDLLLVGRDPDVSWADVLPGLRAAGRDEAPEVNEQQIWDAVWEVLDARINPSVAGHGGSIELVAVEGPDIVIEMKGGCQGCSSAAMTLRHGVENAIRAAVPGVREIRDLTDHAAGSNPYFS